MKPFYIATTSQMKELDRRAIEERGIPSIDLMENAATHVVNEVCQLVESKGLARRAAVFCSQGNNGGDGVAAARLLTERGYEVRCFLSGDRAKMTGDCKANEERLIGVGGALEDLTEITDDVREWIAGCGCIIDALFGFGLSRDLTGIFADVVQLINERRNGRFVDVSVGSSAGQKDSRTADIEECIADDQKDSRAADIAERIAADRRAGGRKDLFELMSELGGGKRMMPAEDCVVVSCDFPSGVNGDTGEIMGCAVTADLTVTFSCGKPGLFELPGAMYSRRVKIVDIGIPADLYAEVGIEGPKEVESDAEFYKGL